MKKYLIISLLCITVAMRADDANTGERYFLDNLSKVVALDAKISEALYAQAATSSATNFIQTHAIKPLSDIFPAMQAIPYVPLGSVPTPVEKLAVLSKELGIELYIKRDDISGALHADGTRSYGGNKVRKLELLFGDALKHGAKTVLTFGAAGSNHAVATAEYAKQLGLRSVSVLTQQIPSYSVRNNLKRMYAADSIMHYCVTWQLRSAGVWYEFLRHKIDHGDYPYFVPTGGSSALGTIGFVNAIFELKQQIDAGMMPEPDYIYVACGSLGTTAGLMIGCRAAGLKTQVIPVGTEPQDWPVYAKKLSTLVTNTVELLQRYDASFPSISLAETDSEIVKDFTGARYGKYTDEGANARARLKETENIYLDGTYTAKTFAALINHAKAGKLNDKVVLFWHTYCEQSAHDAYPELDYHSLPVGLHRFFEEPLQELDVH